MMQSRSTPQLSLFMAAILAVLSLACFALPLYVIQPFRRQGSTELAIALFVKQIGPWVSIACAGLCLLALLFICKSMRSRIARSATVVLFVLALLGAVLTRVNVYEHMFHPIDAPRFESAVNVKLDPQDMVIAVNVNGVSRAYPIREMAYHHVVNDTVGGQPIVATY